MPSFSRSFPSLTVDMFGAVFMLPSVGVTKPRPLPTVTMRAPVALRAGQAHLGDAWNDAEHGAGVVQALLARCSTDNAFSTYSACAACAMRRRHPINPAASGPMICIEISLNGGLLWHVGIENAVAFGAMLNTVFRRQSSAELLAFGIYRLPDGRTAGGYWGESTPVQIGDVVRFALVESDAPTPPTQLHVVDSPEWQETQRLMDALARTYVPPDATDSERRPGLAYRLSINGVYRAMATRKLQAEYLNCTLDWEARQPQQLHFRVGSGSASRPGHEWEAERFRTSVSLGESIEIQVVPALTLVKTPLGGSSSRSGGH